MGEKIFIDKNESLIYYLKKEKNMFECTKIALKETEQDLKRLDYIRNIITQLIYLTHTTIEIVKNFINEMVLWNLILYSILTTLNLAYFIYFIVVVDFNNGLAKPKFLNKSAKFLKVIKRIVRVYTLGMCVSATCNLINEVSPLNIIMTALMIVAFLFQVIFELIVKIVCDRMKYIIEGFNADFNTYWQPVNNILNTFGKGNPEKPELTKNQRKLLLKAQEVKRENKKNTKEKFASIKEEKRRIRNEKIKEFFGNFKSFFKKKPKQQDIMLIELEEEKNGD